MSRPARRRAGSLARSPATRAYAADYLKLFGELADALLGVSIMTDSDNTGSVAIAFYDYIELDRPRR